jgi:hydrogenase nickel incorporation protein HypA/HybF
MHELSLAHHLSEIIFERCGESTVRAVEIEVGSLSGVTPGAFEFCADLVLTARFGKQVKVIIDNKPASARCRCGQHYELSDAFDPCPRCGEYEREIVDGSDIILRSVELES